MSEKKDDWVVIGFEHIDGSHHYRAYKKYQWDAVGLSAGWGGSKWWYAAEGLAEPQAKEFLSLFKE
jgi:hypothetical protein